MFFFCFFFFIPHSLFSSPLHSFNPPTDRLTAIPIHSPYLSHAIISSHDETRVVVLSPIDQRYQWTCQTKWKIGHWLPERERNAITVKCSAQFKVKKKKTHYQKTRNIVYHCADCNIFKLSISNDGTTPRRSANIYYGTLDICLQ